jgi:hypothetical protein
MVAEDVALEMKTVGAGMDAARAAKRARSRSR